MAGPNWYVFLSHGSPDKPFVRRLRAAIEARGYRTWVDENELLPGDTLPAGVSAALSNAAVYIAVISEHSVNSNWFNYELDVAADRMIGRELLAIPARIDDTPVPDALRPLLWADFRSDFESGLRRVLAALEKAAGRGPGEKAPEVTVRSPDARLFDPSSAQARRLEEMLGERVVDVVSATRLFELQAESNVDVPSAQLLDFLSHVSVLVARTELTPTEQDAQLSKAEEHLIRALLEGPEKHVGHRVADLEERRREFVQSDSRSGGRSADAGPQRDTEAMWNGIREGMAGARAGRLAGDWEGAFAAISRLHEVAVLCDELAAQLDRCPAPDR